MRPAVPGTNIAREKKLGPTNREPDMITSLNNPYLVLTLVKTNESVLLKDLEGIRASKEARPNDDRGRHSVLSETGSVLVGLVLGFRKRVSSLRAASHLPRPRETSSAAAVV